MKQLKLIIAALFSISPMAANADVIFDNGGPVPEGGGNETTAWVQADNFGFASNEMVGGGGVYIGSLDDTLANWDGTFEYWIFADVLGTPGGILDSGMAQNVQVTDTGIPWCCGGNYNLFEFDLQNAFSAMAGTSYYLGIHLSSNYDRDELYWASPTDAGTPPDTCESFGGTFDNWSCNRSPRAFYLTGVAEVPEPGTLALLGLGLVGMAARRRKKV